MLAIFGNDPKSYQSNISELLEEEPEDLQTESESNDITSESSGETPLNELEMKNLRKDESDMSSANNNGLPVVEAIATNGSSSSTSTESLSSAFRLDCHTVFDVLN